MTSTASQIDFNDALHDGVLSLIGSINIEGVPVGGVLAKIIGLLWPSADHSKDIWDSLKQYAEEMVKHEIDHERLETLNKRIKGLGNLAHEYRDTSFASDQKGPFLVALMAELLAFEEDFWDERNPTNMFPLYTTFGTLRIGALFDQAFIYKKIWKKPDPDAAKHLALYQENVKKYVDGAQTLYDHIYTSRFRMLEIKEWQSKELKLPGLDYCSEWTFTDKYDGYTKKSSGWELNNSQFHAPEAQALMERELRDKVFNIENNYVKDLQDTLAVAQLWAYLQPEGLRPIAKMVIDGQGPWGGDKDKAQDFEDRPALGPASRITHICMKTEGFIQGLRLAYDGEYTGWHGDASLGKEETLKLDDDEFIVEVSGRASSLIDHLSFKTNKQREIQGGGSGQGAAFSSGGRPDWLMTSLHSIGGWTDGQRVTGLKLYWNHLAALPPYTPTYKSTPSLPLAANLYLKAENGKFISSLVNKYSGKAAANEFFPKLGDNPAALQFVSATNATTLADHGVAQILTTEGAAGKYNTLGKFSSDATYYYLPGYGDRQLWSVMKMVPSDGPIVTGDKIYLRNVDACNYLSVDDEGYLVGFWEPYVWEVVVP